MANTVSTRYRVFPTLSEACCALAAETAELIRNRAASGRAAVLGLPTGGTPLRFYKELVRLHADEALSFANVITFNLDEYLGLSRRDPRSYWSYMHEALFDHVDVPPQQVHIPDGTVASHALASHCDTYEETIRSCGGIDLTVLGIGRSGHIGFNEPGSRPDSRTRVVELGSTTREDAADQFGGLEEVPRRGVSMGVASILDSRRIVLLAGGEAKAGVVASALKGEVTPDIPASFLQAHEDAAFYIDAAASRVLGSPAPSSD